MTSGPDAAPSPRAQRLARAGLVAFVLPLVLAAMLCARLRPAPQACLAPLLGPWAGLLHGHSDCTLARTAPGLALWTSAALLAGLVAAASVRARPFLDRRRLAWLGFTWATLLAWYASAILSIVNSLS